LFVINDLYTRGNGLAASARRTIALLRERGHRVRILSAPPRDGDDCGVGMPEYPLPPMSVPVVGSLIASQGYAFARVRRAQVKRALQWADVVHLEEPFYLQAVVAQLARRAGVPALATYHIHPENLTAEGALFISKRFMNKYDFYTAHYYAMRAYQLSTENEPYREEALRLAAQAWNQIEKLVFLNW